MKFSYSCGQRPLDGYTIKRGIGHGGFGEVYFALSDGGKEVALKVVKNNLDVELRGMSHCLNFKHPNLVQLFDIRQDVHGNHWVIMEYVGGESLSTILSRHPHGLAPELARQWFLGLSQAVTYLHDHGIVHRDLKPGNVFVENGVVKVGDYGLCKFISASQRSLQTQSVGTVHYMAPEISTGNYNKQIDVYGAGVMLYEMLTGQVPFEGESAGEILMKHLTTPPDLNKVPAAFRPILHKALAKNPAHRHRTMLELAREVETAGQDNIPIPEPARPLYVAKPIPVPAEPIPRVEPVVVPFRHRLAELSASLLASALLALLFSILWAAIVRTNDLTSIGRYFFLGLACCWSILIPAKFWTRRVSESLGRRAGLLCLGLLIGLLALWLEGHDLSRLLMNPAQAQDLPSLTTGGPRLPDPDRPYAMHHLFRAGSDIPIVACYLSYFGLAFFGLRWWQLADRRRSQRFSLYSVLAAGLLGFFLLILWPGPQQSLGLISVVMTAVIVQLVSPWQEAVLPRRKKLRLPNA